jgi:hypothetical protein
VARRLQETEGVSSPTWPHTPSCPTSEMVGTTNRSIATMPSAWLRRNFFQPCEGGPLLRAIYLATLVWPISMPSLRSSPWILGAPHSGLAMLIPRISRRISNGTVGRPQRCRVFQRQYDLKPARCRRMTVSGFTIVSALMVFGTKRYSPTKIRRSELRFAAPRRVLETGQGGAKVHADRAAAWACDNPSEGLKRALSRRPDLSGSGPDLHVACPRGWSPRSTAPVRH